jgi:DNA helicase-2/ATP-dependent DNA helicase PcrA
MEMARQAEAVPGLKDRAVKGLRDFGMLLGELSALKDHSAEEVLRRLLNLSGYHKYLAEGKGKDEDRLANVDELVSAARQFDHEHPGASVVEFMEEISLASAVDRWKDESGSVTLMTLHAAKGLEFPVVFMVAVEQGILPHSRSNESEAELEEERRLMFVGITRAQEELFLSHCRIREFRGQRSVAMPSLFLGELPEEPMTVRDHSEPSMGLPSWMPRRPAPASSRPPARPALPGFRISTAADLAPEAAAPAPAGSKDLAGFRPGATVVHPQYGIGRLVAVEGAGPDRKGRVAFTVGGERTFVLSKSPLRVLGGGARG